MKLVSLSLSKEELELITRLVLSKALSFDGDCPKSFVQNMKAIFGNDCVIEVIIV